MKRILPVVFTFVFGIARGQAPGSCASYAYEQEQFRLHPEWAIRLQAYNAASVGKGEPLSGISGVIPADPVIRVPVVVHILYRDNPQLVTNEQVKSQLAALNQAFRRQHADTSLTPDVFKSLSADCYIEFELAHVDPEGYETDGIIRKKTGILNFNVDDRIKFSSQGGDDAWDADRYLNIWVGATAGGIIGYSSVPGCDKKIDGVVIRYSAFGTQGSAAPPYNKGRTAVHEIGHWLGLRHVWGDAYCGNDGMDDTPPQRSATYGCPSGVVISCDNAPSGNMYMNYMDVTYDACTNMFTPDQRARMRSFFAEGGPRRALLSSNALTATPLPRPVGSTGQMGEPGDGGLSIRLFPNPSSSRVQVIWFGEPAGKAVPVSIYDRMGRRLMTIRVTGSQTTLQIAHLPNGLYFIRVGETGKPVKLVKSGVASPR